MVHGLVEGRVCHYRPIAGEANGLSCGWAAVVVKVISNVDGRCNLNVMDPDTGRMMFKSGVQFVPRDKQVPGSWHFVERVE